MSNKNIVIVTFVALAFFVVGFFAWSQFEKNKQGEELDTVASGGHEWGEMMDPGKAKIYFFWGQGNPVCSTAKEFLEGLEQEYESLEVKMFETWQEQKNSDTLEEMNKLYGINSKGVPAIFIGEDRIGGFSQRDKDRIREKVENCLEEGCIDPASGI